MKEENVANSEVFTFRKKSVKAWTAKHKRQKEGDLESEQSAKPRLEVCWAKTTPHSLL